MIEESLFIICRLVRLVLRRWWVEPREVYSVSFSEDTEIGEDGDTSSDETFPNGDTIDFSERISVIEVESGGMFFPIDDVDRLSSVVHDPDGTEEEGHELLKFRIFDEIHTIIDMKFGTGFEFHDEWPDGL
jgi:hypothetical protein